jgi:hypothetical protein
MDSKTQAAGPGSPLADPAALQALYDKVLTTCNGPLV